MRFFLFFFFFNDTATTEIYTLSLHDALPISWSPVVERSPSASGTIIHRREVSWAPRGSRACHAAADGAGRRGRSAGPVGGAGRRGRSAGPVDEAGRRGRSTRPVDKAGRQGRSTRPVDKAGRQGRSTRPVD